MTNYTTKILDEIGQHPEFISLSAIQDPQQETLRTSAARLIWSIAIEPGDQIAGNITELLGPIRALDLLLTNTNTKDFVQAVTTDAARTGNEAPSQAKLASAWNRWKPRLEFIPYETMLQVAYSANLYFITPEHPFWPQQLNRLGPAAPQTLWVKGDPGNLSLHALAVVGSRSITRYGEEVTAELTHAAITGGGAIVSGGAFGVDGVAHRVALQAQQPTVAVLAGGCDRPYPRAHTSLLEEIAEQGAVCSEVPPGTAPTRWRFLQRNRIIAALAEATLVTEASMRSGAINTAGHTAELGNPLGAVPGPITSTGSTGCHRLIREYNAELITNGAQVRALAGLVEGIPSQKQITLDLEDQFDSEGRKVRSPSNHVRILDSLPLRGKLTSHQISIRSGLGERDVNFALSELELIGSVKQTVTSHQTLWSLVR